MVQIVVVVVNLGGGELALVHDVLGGEGADVEALGKGDCVGGMLSQDVELALQSGGIKSSVLAHGSVAVMSSEDDKRLEDDWLVAPGSRSKDSAIRRDRTPTEHTKAQVVGDLGEDRLVSLELDRIVGLEENISDGVLAWLRENTTEVPFSLSLEERVGDSSHCTGTVTVSAISSSSTSVGHRAEQLPRVRHDLVARNSFGLNDEANSAGIFLFRVVVQPLVGGHRGRPGGLIPFYSVESIEIVRGRELVDVW